MDRKAKNIEHLLKKGKVYELKVGNLNVEVSYSKEQKKIDECMLNILKQKNKMGWQFMLDTLHYG